MIVVIIVLSIVITFLSCSLLLQLLKNSDLVRYKSLCSKLDEENSRLTRLCINQMYEITVLKSRSSFVKGSSLSNDPYKSYDSFRKDIAKSVISCSFNNESVLDLCRNSFIMGYKEGRK